LPFWHFDLESRHRGYGPPLPTGIRNGKCCPLSNALNYSNRMHPVRAQSVARTDFWLFLLRCQRATAGHASLRKEVPPRSAGETSRRKRPPCDPRLQAMSLPRRAVTEQNSRSERLFILAEPLALSSAGTSH